MMWDRFERFMRGNVQTRGGQVVHAIVFVLMHVCIYGVFVRLPVFILGWDEVAPAAMDRTGIVVFAVLGIITSTAATSRHMFWRLHQRRPTRREGAIMGFRRGVFVWIIYVAAFSDAYEASWFWTVVVTSGIAFIGISTTVEACVPNLKWARVEEQTREPQRPSLSSGH